MVRKWGCCRWCWCWNGNNTISDPESSKEVFLGARWIVELQIPWKRQFKNQKVEKETLSENSRQIVIVIRISYLTITQFLLEEHWKMWIVDPLCKLIDITQTLIGIQDRSKLTLWSRDFGFWTLDNFIIFVDYNSDIHVA